MTVYGTIMYWRDIYWRITEKHLSQSIFEGGSKEKRYSTDLRDLQRP